MIKNESISRFILQKNASFLWQWYRGSDSISRNVFIFSFIAPKIKLHLRDTREKKDTEQWQPAASHTLLFPLAEQIMLSIGFRRDFNRKLNDIWNCLSGIDSFARVCGAIVAACCRWWWRVKVCLWQWKRRYRLFLLVAKQLCLQQCRMKRAHRMLFMSMVVWPSFVYIFFSAVIFLAKWMIYNISCWNWSWV